MTRFTERPWYIRLAVYCMIGLVAGMTLNVVTEKASGTPGLHDPLHPAVQPAQHTCDDPDTPCYTPEQMVDNLNHDAHGFVHLNPDFGIPPSLRKLIVAAHQKLKRQEFMQGKPVDDWNWASWRLDVHCAGGAGDIYWGCPGAYTEGQSRTVYATLDRATAVKLMCGGIGVYFFLRGGLEGALGTGGLCMMTAFWDIP
jgi:hypothetical protein